MNDLVTFNTVNFQHKAFPIVSHICLNGVRRYESLDPSTVEFILCKRGYAKNKNTGKKLCCEFRRNEDYKELNKIITQLCIATSNLSSIQLDDRNRIRITSIILQETFSEFYLKNIDITKYIEKKIYRPTIIPNNLDNQDGVAIVYYEVREEIISILSNLVDVGRLDKDEEINGVKIEDYITYFKSLFETSIEDKDFDTQIDEWAQRLMLECEIK